MRNGRWWKNLLGRKNHRRHACDKGDPHQRLVADGFRILLNKRYWRRHAEPFAKTRKGLERRRERRFVFRNKFDPEDGFFAAQEEKLETMTEMRRAGCL